MKTLNQIKDEVAKKYGYNDWQDITTLFHHSYERYSKYEDEAAKLYASEALREAAKSAKTKPFGTVESYIQVVDKESILKLITELK